MQINSTTAGGAPNAKSLGSAHHPVGAFQQLLDLGTDADETASATALSAQTKSKTPLKATKNVSTPTASSLAAMAMPIVVPVPAAAVSHARLPINNEAGTKIGVENNSSSNQQAGFVSSAMRTLTPNAAGTREQSQTFLIETLQGNNDSESTPVPDGSEKNSQSSVNNSVASATVPDAMNGISAPQVKAAAEVAADEMVSAASMNGTVLDGASPQTNNQGPHSDDLSIQTSPASSQDTFSISDLASNTNAFSTSGLLSTMKMNSGSGANDSDRAEAKEFNSDGPAQRDLPDAQKNQVNPHNNSVVTALLAEQSGTPLKPATQISQSNHSNMPANNPAKSNGIDNRDASSQEKTIFVLNPNALNSNTANTGVSLHADHGQKTSDTGQTISAGNSGANNSTSGGMDSGHDKGAGHENSSRQFAATGTGNAHQKISDKSVQGSSMFSDALKNQTTADVFGTPPASGHTPISTADASAVNSQQNVSGGLSDLSADRNTDSPGNTAAAGTVVAHAHDIVANDNLPLNAGLQSAHITAVAGEQAEMKIGMRMQAFGAVEVHASVHQSQVGLIVGSEQGDLKSFFNAEIPALRASLNQHDLHFANVRYEGLGEQSRSFQDDGGSRRDSQQQRYTHNFAGSGFAASFTRPSDAELLTTSQSGLSIHA